MISNQSKAFHPVVFFMTFKMPPFTVATILVVAIVTKTPTAVDSRNSFGMFW